MLGPLGFVEQFEAEMEDGQSREVERQHQANTMAEVAVATGRRCTEGMTPTMAQFTEAYHRRKQGQTNLKGPGFFSIDASGRDPSKVR